MKTVIVILMLLTFNGLSFGQENETEIKKDIAEAVFRYEIINFIKVESVKYRDIATYKITCYELSADGFDINTTYLSRFNDLSKYIVSKKEKCGHDKLEIHVDRAYFVDENTAFVSDEIRLTSKPECCKWTGHFTVKKIDGVWLPQRIRRTWWSDA